MPTPLGSFVWYEYMASDAKAAADFYARVVGWSAKDAGMADLPYTLFSTGPNVVAGLMALPEEALEMGARPGWLGYVGVPDVDAYAAKIAAGGGKVYRAPADIPTVGRFAVVGDPHGAAFVVFKGQPAEDPRPPMASDAPGNVGWRELRAGDLDSAFAFYSLLFGWKKTQAIDMGPMGDLSGVRNRRRTGRRHGDQVGRDADAVLALLLQCRRHRRRRRARQRRRRPRRQRPASGAWRRLGSPSPRSARREVRAVGAPALSGRSRRKARKGLLDRVVSSYGAGRVSRRGR